VPSNDTYHQTTGGIAMSENAAKDSVQRDDEDLSGSLIGRETIASWCLRYLALHEERHHGIAVPDGGTADYPWPTADKPSP